MRTCAVIIAALAITSMLSVQAQEIKQASDGAATQEANQLVPTATQGSVITSNSPTSADPKEFASKLMLQERFDDAYKLMVPFVPAHPGDTQARFLLGIAASSSGRRDEAINQFQQILENNPDLPRVRLELARVYAQSGRFEEARPQFKSVLQTDPPVYVRQNIELFLARMKKQPERKSWQLFLSAGYLYDDNATAGPEARTAEFFGLPFLLSPGARQQSDSAITTRIAFSHYLAIQDDFGIRSNLSFNSVTYFDYKDLNFERFSVSIGPAFYGERWSLLVPVVGSYSRLGSESYRNAYGVAPEFRYAITKQWLAIGRGLVTANDYYDRDGRDGSTWSINLAARRLIGNDGFIEFGYRHGWANTDADILSNDRDALYAALFRVYSKTIRRSPAVVAEGSCT